MKKPDPQDWSQYWKLPAITSFGNLFPDNYDGSMLEFWKEQLEGEFNHVVDVACGNGALTWIANDLLNSGARQTPVTGTDFASISPFKVLRRNKKHYPSIRFRGNTPAEHLPFKDRSIDLVISQYGVEYADLDRAIPELGRVLSTAGRMSFILHDKESVIIKGATGNLDGFKLVLNEIAIHDLIMQHEELAARIKDPVKRQNSAEYQRLFAQINDATNTIKGLVRNYPPPSPIHLYMDQLSQALNAACNNQGIDRKALIIQARDGLQIHIDRIDDLEAAALSEAQRRHLVSLIERQGFTLTEHRMLCYKGNDNFGTVLAAQRETN